MPSGAGIPDGQNRRMTARDGYVELRLISGLWMSEARGDPLLAYVYTPKIGSFQPPQHRVNNISFKLGAGGAEQFPIASAAGSKCLRHIVAPTAVRRGVSDPNPGSRAARNLNGSHSRRKLVRKVIVCLGKQYNDIALLQEGDGDHFSVQ